MSNVRVICDACPVFHVEPIYEGYDPKCGLGYTLKRESFKLSQKEDEGWISENCQLHIIKFGEGQAYRPVPMV